MTTKNDIKDKIAKNQIAEVIEYLKTNIHDTYQNEIYQLGSRFSDLEKKVRIGIVSIEQEELLRNKIRWALLEIVSNSELGDKRKIVKSKKIISTSYEYELNKNVFNKRTSEQEYRDLFRKIFTILSYAYEETKEVSPKEDFISLIRIDLEQNEQPKIIISIISYKPILIYVFFELLDLVTTNSDKFLKRTEYFGDDYKVKLSYTVGNWQPYRIRNIGLKQIHIECLVNQVFKFKLPIETDDLMKIISSMMNGKPLIFDDLDFTKLSENEVNLMKYMDYAKENGLRVDDFDINLIEPNKWKMNKNILNKI